MKHTTTILVLAAALCVVALTQTTDINAPYATYNCLGLERVYNTTLDLRNNASSTPQMSANNLNASASSFVYQYLKLVCSELRQDYIDLYGNIPALLETSSGAKTQEKDFEALFVQMSKAWAAVDIYRMFAFEYLALRQVQMWKPKEDRAGFYDERCRSITEQYLINANASSTNATGFFYKKNSTNLALDDKDARDAWVGGNGFFASTIISRRWFSRIYEELNCTFPAQYLTY